MSLRGRGQESGMKAALLDWCKNRIGGYKGVKLTNLTTSWNDGLAFCALVHSIDPTALDYDSLNPAERLKNCKMAFAAASKLGISALLDAEDVVEIDCPEPLSMMTYISQYYHHVNGTGRNWNGSLRGSPTPDDSASARSHGLMRSSVDISALELNRMRGEAGGVRKPAASAAAPAEKAQAPVSYIPRPDLARTGSFRGSALARQVSPATGRPAATLPAPQSGDRLVPPSLRSRQVSSPVLRTDTQEKRKQDETREEEEEQKKKKQTEEAEQTRAEAEKRKSNELEAKRKKEEKEWEAAKGAKVQQDTERQSPEQKRRDEQRQQQANATAVQASAEEERKKARLAKWAVESSAAEQQTMDATLSIARVGSSSQALNGDGEIRIKCLDDGAEWVVPVTKLSEGGFEGAVKCTPAAVSRATQHAQMSSCLVM